MSTLLVNQINPVSGNTLTLSGSNIIIPGNLTITGNLSGSLTGSVTSASYALTASYVLDGGSTTSTSSLLTTASISGQTLTFTKGDASTFDVTIPSGDSIDTGSFATTGSNIFSGSQTITGSLNVSGSSTFRGNQIVNANLTLTSSATMSILSTGGSTGMVITRDQININPNLNLDRATLSGGDLQLSAANGYSGLYLTNRNGSNYTSSIEIHRTEFYGKETDANFGLKAGLRVFQSAGTGSSGYINFYTSASAGLGFTSGDLDMRISTGSRIELFRNTTITGSLNVKGDVNLSGSKQVGIEADASKTFIKSTGVFINEDTSIAKATLSPGALDITGRPGAAEVILRNNNDSDDATFDAGQISFYGSSDSNAYGGVQGKIQARVDSGSGAVASHLEFYTAGNGGFPFDSSDIDMRISSGSSIELFRNTTISGSLKQGHLVTSSGNFSHAEGYKSQAVGQYSHAEGGGPAGTFTEQLGGRATGTGSHAEGSFTLASGSFSHAEGQFTTASAPWSHAEGLGTIANGWYQHVQGAYNVPSSEQSAFIVGNGVADEARSNLLFASGELIQVTGSVSITSVLTLTPNNPLPSGQPTGSIAVSGSGADCKPYFYNGTDWTSMI